MRIPLIGWGGLGFYRGMMDYQHDVTHIECPPMYISQLYYGVIGTMCYLNPCFLVIFIPKELYRLDVNLRGLEHEKTTDKYNKLI